MNTNNEGLSAARIIRFGLEFVRSLRAQNRFEDHAGDDVIVLAYERPEPTITVRGFAVLVAAFLVFKGAVIAHLGADVYEAALLNLQYGAWVEQAGAFIMSPDPLSQAIAARLAPMF